MKANEVSLNSFLSQTKTQFIIPVYQRNYDWTENQCSQLLADILAVGNRPNETHFIGSIVFIHDGVYTSSSVKQLVVIDGQQRLTTFSLMYLALYKYAFKNGLEEKASEINETYLVNKFVKDDISKLKLKQSDVNARALRFIMTDNDPAGYKEFSRVIENYNYFKQQISKDNFELIQNGLNRLLFVEISLERGKDDPQRIFESLNSTGLELSQADLIRNYILMGLEPDKQVEVFNNYWEIIESNARDNEIEESRVSDFIRDYLTYKSKKIPNKGKVYDEFKLRYTQRDDEFYKNTLTELKEFSHHYHKLLNPSQESDADIRRELFLIKRLEINISFPFLVPVYEDFRKALLSKMDFVKVLQLLQSYVWRRFIAGLPTNALNKIFMTLYGEIDQDDYVGSLEQALGRKRGAQRFPNDKDIEIALLEKDVYNIQSKNRVYFLELLENYNNREFVSVDNPDITIEHIFPQTPDEKWYNELPPDEVKAMSEKYLNTIANLTLSGNNGSLSNKSFLEKKSMNKDGKEQGYNYSRLWLNQYLKQIDAWRLGTLMERYALLLDRFHKIWPFPNVEIDDEFDAEAEYNIYNSPDPKNRKLDYFIFRDEKVGEQEIAKMYYHVIKKLFDENPNAFIHQDVKSLIGLTANADQVRAPFAISPSYYIESNIDSNTKFRRLKTLLSRFDCEEDLLIKFADDELDEEDEVENNEQYWRQKAGENAMRILGEYESILKGIDPSFHLSYKARYIGIKDGKKVKNISIIHPKSTSLKISLKVPDVNNWIEKINKTTIKFHSVSKRNGRLKFSITEEDMTNHRQLLFELISSGIIDWKS